MLADRPYMRGGSLEGRRSATVLLVIINVAVFFLEDVLYGFHVLSEGSVRSVLALSTEGIQHGYVWQLLTFQFLHQLPWPWHLLFNCLALYVFGREVENALGRKAFLKLYLISGVLGGVVQLIFGWMTHHSTWVVGASAGVLGLVAAYASLFPERQITLLLFFFIPVTLKARYLFWGALALSVIGATQANSTIAHAAHLGGLLAGFAYIRWGLQAESWWEARRNRRPRPRQRELVRVASSKSSWQRSKTTPEELPPEEFISREVDPILDKISAHGLHSLTPRERQILEAARARMGKRS
jgi:rhomboid family protein